MTLIDFTVDLLDGLLVDIEGRAEVVVTYPGHRAYFDAVSGAADPGGGPEIRIEGIELTRRVWGNRNGCVTVRFEYEPVPDTDLGRAMEAAIRDELNNDADWIASAAQQARRAA